MKYLMLSFLFLPLNLAFSQSKETPLVSTVLGVQAVGYRDFSGPPILLLPVRLASDLAGNVFVVDRVGNKVWKITPNGVAVLFAGSGF